MQCDEYSVNNIPCHVMSSDMIYAMSYAMPWDMQWHDMWNDFVMTWDMQWHDVCNDMIYVMKFTMTWIHS